MERFTHCPLDCPDACSLRVEVQRDRIVRVDGSDRNPITAGYICSKVRDLPAHLYGADRLLYPAVRDGAKGEARFRRVGWEEALEHVARRLGAVKAESGGEAILPFFYGGSNGLLTQDAADARFFRRLGASNLARTVCAAPTTSVATAMYGKMPGVAFSDYVEARLVVIWGCNPAASGIHLVPYLREARRRGARLVVVDPRRTRLAGQADLHLPVRPGSDVAVALAIVNWLFEQGGAAEEFLALHTTGRDALRSAAAEWPIDRAARLAGLDAADLERLARWYSDTDPAVIRVGWGLERNRNGGGGVAAVLALPAVAGKFGRRGGGYTLSNAAAFSLRGDRAANAAAPPTRTINMNHLGRVLEDATPPVRALFVYNCTPLAPMPDQERVRRGLAREDLFTVVYEQVMTDTAAWADVLLPATNFLEHEELRAGYGAMVLQHAGAVVPPAGESRPNYEVFAELCERLGLSHPDDPRDNAEVVARVLGANGLGATLAREGIAFPELGSSPVQFVDHLPRTPDSRIHLFPEALEAEANGFYRYRADPATQAHPLALISPATGKTISSTFGQLQKGTAALQMHPDDAAARDLASGDRIRVFNERGEVHCLLEVTTRMRPGVVYLPKGLWGRSTLNGATSNALVSDALTDVAGGATFNDARVEVEALGPGTAEEALLRRS